MHILSWCLKSPLRDFVFCLFFASLLPETPSPIHIEAYWQRFCLWNRLNSPIRTDRRLVIMSRLGLNFQDYEIDDLLENFAASHISFPSMNYADSSHLLRSLYVNPLLNYT